MATLKGVLKAGKKMAGEAATKKKNQMVAGVGNAVFGSGMVGGALNKAFQGKFGEKQENDTRVADALEAQTKVQEQNSAVLTRIESIVMNIADNVYNLAGVMNAQVVSMQEAQKIQQDRAFKDAAAQEEATAEAKKVQGPVIASTPTKPVEDKKSGIMGMIQGLLGSIGSTKNLFKGFLKKFGVLALGITSVLGVAALSFGGSDDEEEKKNEDPSGTISVMGDAQAALTPSASATEPTKTSQPLEQPQQQATPVKTSDEAGGMSSSFTGPMGAPNPAAGSNAPSTPITPTAVASPTPASTPAATPATTPATPTTPPAATPAAPPPSVAASKPEVDPEVTQLNEYFQKPENAAEKAQLDELGSRETKIKLAIDHTKSLISSATTPEEKTKHTNILKNQLVPSLAATREQKKTIINEARKTVGMKPGTAASAPSSAPSGGAAAGGAMGGGGGAMSGGGGGGGGGGGAMSGGGGGGASPVASSPSTGADIGSTSTAVAAASEPSTPKNNVSEFSTNKNEGSPPPSAIPSTIAKRGSLDIGTVFGSES